MPKIAAVVVENATPSFDKIFSYLIPDGMTVSAGCRVTVPFGAGNRTRFALVMEIYDDGGAETPAKLKSLASTVDVEPLLNDEMLALVRYLHDTTFCAYFDAVRTLLPPGIGVKFSYIYELTRELRDAQEIAEKLAVRGTATLSRSPAEMPGLLEETVTLPTEMPGLLEEIDTSPTETSELAATLSKSAAETSELAATLSLSPAEASGLAAALSLSPAETSEPAATSATAPISAAPDLSEDEKRVLEYLEGRGKPVREEQLCAAMGLLPDAPVLRNLCALGLVQKSQEVRRKVLDGKLVMARLADGINGLSDVTAKITAKQRDVIELLEQVGQASVKEVCYFAAVGKAVVERLKTAGVIEYYIQEIYRSPYSEAVSCDDAGTIELSDEQQTAYKEICLLADVQKPSAALLYGVTGSGKTEVFLRAIRHVIAGGRGVIVMVPEISLTPQAVERYRKYFGAGVAVLHSGLSMTERLDEWKRIRAGGAKIVVGTRSAVFAPLADIGLIVVDEEQESTYKSEKSPRYHARDVAGRRAAYHNALLLLASATPSVESFYRAKTGKYKLLTLKNRYGAAELPEVHILDMSLQALDTRSASISSELVGELRRNLEKGEQSILLLNRRGYNTLCRCAVCATVANCPNCSVALTYHSANGHLMCHYCGYTSRADEICPTCGGKFRRFFGAGTQKVEEELCELFPDARVLRMDMDTTMARFSHERHFADFSAGKYDIIIGTQMVAKGLDFPNVTLVGILSADASLYAQDYRSFERAFSLFTQVVGRSGRAKKAGRAYIQTFTPENPVIEMAAAQDYNAFYRDEIESRRIHLYPPFCEMIGVGFSGLSGTAVRDASRRFLALLTSLAKTDYPELPLRVLGPCESQMLRMAGKYRWRMAIKCVYSAKTRELLRRVSESYYAKQENREVTMFIDPKYENAI